MTDLGKKLDEQGTTTTKLLEFMKSFAPMLQDTQNSMVEQQKSMVHQQEQLGAITENMNKLPAIMDKMKSINALETLNY